jgi:SAM-dependent methyltransferase
MTLPPALAQDATERLRTSPVAPAASAGRAGGTAGGTARAKQLLRRTGGRVLRKAEAVGLLRARQAAHQANVRLDGLERTVDELRTSSVSAVVQRDRAAQLSEQVHALTVNQSSLKDEVRRLEAIVLALGWAIAPGAGIEGAEVRLAELRERVNGLDRRLRTLALPSSAPTDGAAITDSGPTTESAPAAAPQSALFDYVGFERRFRGDPDAVSTTLWERYGERLAAHPPVVDLGCGRAELLVRLRERGVEAHGVDTDPSMVLEARDAGLDVVEADALSWLAAQPEHSLGSIIATHLVEHLQLDDLVRLLELAVSRLKPGGVFIAETPNPQSLIVLGNSYVLDPTHVRPVHPSLLTFLCEGAGFRDVRVEFFAPAVGYHLPPISDPAAPAWVEQLNDSLEKLNQVLFGPQDYAAIATTPDA